VSPRNETCVHAGRATCACEDLSRDGPTSVGGPSAR
jgi:hypothetical protein